MEINEFMGISIVGVGLSLGFEFVQRKYGMTSGWSKFIVLVSSLVLGGAYVWVRNEPYFPTVLTILGTSSLIYSFFFKGSQA